MKHLLLSIVMLSCSTACCDFEPKSLPDITDTGKGTFGCYVNNQLFVGVAGLYDIFAEYHIENGDVRIYSYAKGNRVVYLFAERVEIGKSVPLKFAEYRTGNSLDKIIYRFLDDRNVTGGTIIVTKIDLDNRIICGTFAFKAQDAETGEIVTVTEGRFDLENLYHDRDWADLNVPEITDTGKGTFGCHADGILFLRAPGQEGESGNSNLRATYYTERDCVLIVARSKDNRSISLCRKGIEAGKSVPLLSAEYCSFDGTVYRFSDDADDRETGGTITVSKLDLDNYIISGTFDFKAQDFKTGKIVSVSMGRFDIAELWHDKDK